VGRKAAVTVWAKTRVIGIPGKKEGRKKCDEWLDSLAGGEAAYPQEKAGGNIFDLLEKDLPTSKEDYSRGRRKEDY